MNNKYLWTNEYSVNVKEIDEQHKHFINICNDLLDLAQSESLSSEEALNKVGQLGSYAFFHLSTEEDLFEKTNYPDTQTHLLAHNQFRAKTQDYIEKVREDGADLKKTINDVAVYTVEWLFNHILSMDKSYSNYFNEHGVN